MKEIQVTKREPVPQDGDGGVVPNKKKKIPVEKELGQRFQVTGEILRQSNDWRLFSFSNNLFTFFRMHCQHPQIALKM